MKHETNQADFSLNRKQRGLLFDVICVWYTKFWPKISPQTSFVNKIPCMYSLCPGNLFMKTKRNKLKVLKGVCLYWLVKTAQVRVRTRVTNVEAKGIMGRRKTTFYFLPSSARKFSSRERRLGTRQNKGYPNSLMISIPNSFTYGSHPFGRKFSPRSP